MLLDFFARTYTPYLHARGRQGTRVMICALQPVRGQRVLEIGFGAGQTLVDIAAQFPGIALYGVERSTLMLESALLRLRFCGISDIRLQVYTGALPFSDGFFDAVYCESVLAIAPDNTLPDIFGEIHRVLKPGGRFCCNESLWLDTTAPETIRVINQRCLEYFGIVQASEKYPRPEDWRALGASTGLQLQKTESLEDIPKQKSRPMTGKQVRSFLFSRFGWMIGRLHPRLNRKRLSWQKNARQFEKYGQFLRGYLMVFQKPPSG